MIDVAPLSRELLEAVTALIAVVVLIGVSFWLVARLEHKRRMEFMRARVASAMAAGTTAAFVGLGFTAVFREGFETVLFYQALALFAEGLILWVVLGAVAAAIALGGVAYAILRLGKQLPLRPMLVTGAAILLLMSVAFIGNAVFSLQEADFLAATPVDAPAPAGVPRRADRHPPDLAGPAHPGRRARDLRPRRPLRVRVAAGAATAPRGGDGDGVSAAAA